MPPPAPSPIDFVIPWVDGNDPAWRNAMREARRAVSTVELDDAEIRYRDFGTLRYWFRSVERFAPWAGRIHLITWGHLPAWLRCDHPRLHIVRHEDYLPARYRPSFNSNTLELNIARIEGLAERLVLFNDDTFLLRRCRPEDFFRAGLPCDMARLSVVQPSSVGHIVYNDLELINAAFSQRRVLRRHAGKWFSPRYGIGQLLKSLTLAPWSTFPGILDHHMPQPYLRRQFVRAWERWGDALDASCRHTFRQLTDHSHRLIRYDALCRGEFAPRSMADCRLLTLADETIDAICRIVEHGSLRMVCLNDGERIADFERLSARLIAAFERLLPEKSSYEK